mmetsp:Transcript_41910/g.100987  ORF Transcript_41910/g.100987 Transcript_41910/m.100987 type:complete len:521 (-) Transcript_41910:3359-4921(-)
MLRQALDDASPKSNQIGTEELRNAGENDPLLRGNQESNLYATNSDAEVSESGRSYDDEYEMIEQWNDDNVSEGSEVGFLTRFWKATKEIIMLIINVDNLWDSPTTRNVSRRSKAVVFFWFFILSLFYTAERTMFKFLVDRAGPFRLFAVELVAASHALMVAIGMLISAISRKDFGISSLGIPIIDVGLMALLDTLHMILVFITGIHVSPTLTVILVQFTLPLTAFITQVVHPDGCTKYLCGCTRWSEAREQEHENGLTPTGWGGLYAEHVVGCVIISLAVLLALCPAIYSIWDPLFFLYADTIPLQTAYNTLLFVSSCIPAAASQLYKEHVFLQHKRPIQADHLNMVLSIFQLIFASIMAPLVYNLQGLAASKHWPKLYPSSGITKNIQEGIQCFFGSLDEDQALNGYEDEALCDYSLGLVLGYSFSIIAVGVAVDKIVNAGATKVMYRGVSAGIVLSSIILFLYDESIPDFSYGPAIDSLNLVCVLLLILGAEVYHRQSLQNATFETEYQTIDDFYDQE